MGKFIGYKCDGTNCRETRDEHNHWILAITSAKDIRFMALEGNEFLLDDKSEETQKKALCSRECAYKILDLFFGNLYQTETAKPSEDAEHLKHVPDVPANTDFDTARANATYLDRPGEMPETHQERSKKYKKRIDEGTAINEKSE